MDRRDFLWVSASAGVGAAVAGATSVFTGGPVVVGTQKGGGRELVAEPVAARGLAGVLPFALARFAEDETMIAGLSGLAASGGKLLSPLRDASFHGFGDGAGTLAADQLQVVAVHMSSDGVRVRHELWSHAPQHLGGSSQSLLFTAHDDAFSGFEVTHIPVLGSRSSAFFSFMASGSGPQLKPGVYVLAGPRMATGLAPELGRYGYSGNLRAPVRESRLLGLDFAYISFAVHGEWV